MPGRHGKQRVKKKKSKRVPVTEMERVLKDSIHGRKRTEAQILKNLVPPLHQTQVKKPVLTSDLPMFSNAVPGVASSSVMQFSVEAKKTEEKIKEN